MVEVGLFDELVEVGHVLGDALDGVVGRLLARNSTWRANPRSRTCLAHDAALVAGVDALEDAGQLPVAERVVVDVDTSRPEAAAYRSTSSALVGNPSSVVDVSIRAERVVGRGRSSTRAAGRRRPAGRPACTAPSRAPPGWGRPGPPCSCRGGSRRGRSRRALLGDPGRQGVVDLVDHRQLAGLGLLPLPVPAPQLPLDVALGAAQVGQADGVEVDGVDAGQDVGDLAAGVRRGPRRRAGRPRRCGRPGRPRTP